MGGPVGVVSRPVIIVWRSNPRWFCDGKLPPNDIAVVFVPIFKRVALMTVTHDVRGFQFGSRKEKVAEQLGVLPPSHICGLLFWCFCHIGSGGSGA
jgi:hypothetical protein